VKGAGLPADAWNGVGETAGLRSVPLRGVQAACSDMVRQIRLNKRLISRFSENFGDPGEIRTPNLWNRNPLLYPVELRGRWAEL
jgi:hypothetical protein